MSNTINYVVTYDSDISDYSGPFTTSTLLMRSGTAVITASITNLEFQRNIAPADDSATINLAGIVPLDSAREVYFYRVNSDNTLTLKFRGMTTNPDFTVASEGNSTEMAVQSLWYMLGTRLFAIAGKSPPPLQPNTNPYLLYLNPALNLDFGELWTFIIASAFQERYGTGHLLPFKLANLSDDGTINVTIPQFTDFDNVVVNDNMNIQYQNVSGTIDRLVTSALFNANNGNPFLAEYRMDIGDFPRSDFLNTENLYSPKLPSLTVMLFDPIHSILGNGQNRTGTTIGDNSIFTNPDGTIAVGSNGYFPMCYAEFGVVNGYEPIDGIIYSEGDNIISIKPTSDYVSMNNSWVLTGGSFQGSDVVAVPIENQRSIAEYGLKQTNQTLQNVVDQGEISRYVGTSIGFFQHPIPNIVLIPDYVYASTHPLYPGDYITVNAPSLVGALQDSNGNVLGQVFIARVKTIDITWNPTDGENITITLTFPVFNLQLEDWPASLQNTNGGAMQFMYTTVSPTAKTVIGKERQGQGAATYGTGGDFLTNRSNHYSIRVMDSGSEDSVVGDFQYQTLPIWAQKIANAMNATGFGVETYCAVADSILGNNDLFVNSNVGFSVYDNIVIGRDGPRAETNTITGLTGSNTIVLANNLQYTHTVADGDFVDQIASVKADDVLLYQFGVEVDSTSGGTTANDVWLTVIQPDGMAIYDGILNADQFANILSLLVKAHTTQVPEVSNPLTGITTSATSTVLTNTHMIIVPNFYIGLLLTYTTGSAAGQSQTISTNTQTTITTTAPFSPAPSASGGDSFQVNSGSAPLFNGLSGSYQLILRNTSANAWCPIPLLSSLAPPTSSYTGSGPNVFAYLYCSVDVNGNEFGQSFPVLQYFYIAPALPITLTWGIVAGANSYNVYKNGGSVDSPFTYLWEANVSEPTWTDTTPNLVTSTPETQPFNSPLGISAIYNGNAAVGSYLVTGHQYWYAVTAINPEGNETEPSQATTIFIGNNTVAGGQPDANLIPEGDVSLTPPVQCIEISWPNVPFATNYNIYKSDGYLTMKQLNTGISGTTYTDDGSIDSSGGAAPPAVTMTTPTNALYTLYVNYSFQQDPTHTTSVTTGGISNPATSVNYDPTQRRIYQTFAPYVAP